MALLKTRKRVPRRIVRILTARKSKGNHGLAPRSIHVEAEPPEGEGEWSEERLFVFSKRLNKVVELKPEQYKVVAYNTDKGWHS